MKKRAAIGVEATNMNANQLVNALIVAEMSHPAPDARRVIRDERLALQTVLRLGTRSEIGEQMAEAARVARMWGVEVAS